MQTCRSWIIDRIDDFPNRLRFNQRVHNSLLFVCTGMILICLAGCGSGGGLERLPVHPVSGTLQFGSQSLEGALVVFHPAQGSDPRVIPARGTVDASGKVQITTYETHDGAVAGDFIVTVVRTPLIERDGDHVAGPNVLPSKYAKVETSDLKVTVQTGPNEFGPLQLK